MNQLDQVVQHGRNQESIVQLSLIRGQNRIHFLIGQISTGFSILHNHVNAALI